MNPICSGMKSNTAILVGGIALAVCLATLALLYVVDPGGHFTTDGKASRDRVSVPIDHERVVSLFQIFVDGGLRQMMATDESDPEQIASIRAHLNDQARKFRGGDFSDAAALHSEEMAWLADLKSGTEEIDVQYRDLPNGGEIRYVTRNPALVSAVHRWLMAGVTESEREMPNR